MTFETARAPPGATPVSRSETRKGAPSPKKHFRERTIVRLPFEYRGQLIEVLLDINSYDASGNMAVMLYSKVAYGFSLLCHLTVETGEICNKNCAFIDISNNGPKILDWLADNELAVPTGRVVRSGYVKYPEYKFDAAALRVLDPVGYTAYCCRLKQ